MADTDTGVDAWAEASRRLREQQLAPQVANSISNAASVNPEGAAKANVTARFLGIPAESAAAFPEDVARQAKVQQLNPQNLVNTSPVLSRFLTVQSTANAIHDDIPNASAIEQTAKQAPAAPAVPSQPSLLSDLWTGINHTGLNVLGAWDKAAVALSDAMPEGTPGKMSAEDRAKYADRGSYLQGPEQAGAPANTPQRWTGMVSSGLTYAPFGAAAPVVMGGTEGTALSQHLQDQGVDKSTANKAGAAGGVVMGLANFIPMGNLATSEGVLPFIRSLFGATVKSGAVGAGQSVVGDAATSALLDNAGYAKQAQENAPSIEKAWESALFMAGMHVGMQGLHAAGGVVTQVRETHQAAAAEKDFGQLTTLGQLSAASKWRERDPEGFKQFVQATTEDGNLAHVYVDAKTFAQSLDKAGITADELKTKMPEVAAQMVEALHTQGDVKIPTADYATHIAGGPLDADLLQHLKTDPEGKTYAEAKQFYQDQAEKMKETAAQVVAGKEEMDKFRTSQQVVQNQIHNQLDALGRQSTDVNKINATVQSAILSRVAAAEKITPEEAYAKYGAKLAGESAQGDLSQGAPKGLTVEGYHYSKAERSRLTTGLFGTGLQGSARDEIMNHPDKRLSKRLSFYVDKGTGINPEAGVGGIAHKATLTNLYDANSDPLRLRKGSARDFEGRVLDHGYSGYVDRMDGTQSGHAILLGDHTITPELLGPQTKLKGEVVPAPAARASLGRDKVVDALQANKNLPMGSPTREMWDRMLSKMAPEEHAALKDAGVFDGKPTDPLYKSDLIKAFEAKTEAPDYAGAFQQTLPSRWPTAKGLEPSVNDVMLPDLATLKEDPKQYEQAVDAVRAEPGMRTKSRTTDKMAEEMINRMVDNLLWLHDQVPSNIRDRSKLWYDGAQKIATKWSEKWDKTRAQTAGMLAVLSPQKDWFMNTTMAERVGDILHGQMEHAWDTKMTASAFKFLAGDAAKADPEAAKNTKAFEEIKGKTLAETVATGDKRAIGIWIRAYDEAHHAAPHAIISPEGNFEGNKLTGKGEEARRAWGEFSAIGKAASIFIDGRPENINEQIGGEHKVRNFYNNIFNASDARFTTIDTHAVAAALLRPLAGADKPVADNFGATGGTNQTGVSGSYPLYYEAYKRAAEQRGVLPREMQSITWEAVRGLFTEGFKTAANKADIDKLWKQVDTGKLTVDEARQQLLEKAGGIEHPDWWTGGEPKDNEVLRDKTYDQERGAHQGAKVTFEVAPDPRDTELKAAWDALAPEVKQQVSHQIAWHVAMRALNHLGLKAELHEQLGGWMDDTNPSLALWLDKNSSGSKAVELAKMLGYALNQEGMMVTSLKKFPDANKGGAVLVKIPAEFTPEQIHSLYTEIRAGVKGDDGESLVNGHSTGDGYMAILNDGSKIETHPLALKVAELLGDRHEVGDSDIFVSFPEKGEDEYGLRGQTGSGKGGAKPPAGTYADSLRTEASEQLQRALGRSEASDPGHPGFGEGNEPAADTTGRSGELNQSGTSSRLAPNGKPSKLSPEHYALVRTPEFKGWFGDWEKFHNGKDGNGVWSDDKGEVSKVVDENGEPLVVYHGTDKGGFTSFNEAGGQKRGDLGIFLTPNRDMARSYVKRGRGVDFTRDQLEARDEENPENLSGIYPLFANIRHPYETDFEGAHWNGDREEQYLAVGEDGEAMYNDKGQGYLPYDEAQALAEEKGGRVEEAAPHYESTDTAVMTARKDGNDGAAIRNVVDDGGGDSAYYGTPSDVFVAFDPTQVKSVDNFGTFNPNDTNILRQPTGARGTFNPTTKTIALLKDADLSTYLHETGHWALDTYARIADSADAPPEIKADMAKILKWFGVGSLDKWHSMTLDEQRTYHEQFARGFEAYLMEGKAPSQELAGPFARIRSWMVDIYKSLRNLNVELTPEVRSVFDRMMASEDAIQQAQAARVFEPLFTEKPPGMSAQEWADYRDLGQEATNEAISQMQGKSLRDMKWLSNAKSKAMKDLQRQAKAARDEVRAQVEKEVGDMPVYRMEDWLKENNKTSDADKQALKEWNERRDSQREKAAEAVKAEYLAKPEAAELKGLEKAQYVSRARREMANETERRVLEWEKQNKKPSLVKPEIDTELLAERFGFGSGEEAMRALAEAQPRKEVIDGMTDRRMLEEHGELSNRDSIEAAANEAVHNAARARFMATGLKVLAKSPISARMLLNGAREAAEGAIAAKLVRDINPRQYLAAETRANKEAIKLAPTDPAGAVQAQRAALLNNQLVKAAYDAQDLVRKALAYAKSFDRVSKRLKIEPEERDMIDALLARFDFRQSPPTGPSKKQLQLAQWVESQKALGYTPAEIPDMLNPEVRMHYKDMSIEQLRGLMDTIRSIEKVGRERHTVTVDGKRMDVQEAVEPMVAKMLERGEKFTDAQLAEKPRYGVDPTWRVALDRVQSLLRAGMSEFLRPDYKGNKYDMHEVLGPFQKAITERLFKAGYDHGDFMDQVATLKKDRMQQYGLDKDWQHSLDTVVANHKLMDNSLEIPMKRRLTRGDLIGIAMHVGNESNFDKLVQGMKWAPEDVWTALHDNLTAKDWNAAKTLGEMAGAKWEEMAAMNRRLGNDNPEKIEPRPFQTKFGEMPGWYSPIDYDPIRSRLGKRKTDAKAVNPAEGLFSSNYYRADTTTNGSLNSRASGYYDFINLDWRPIEKRINDTMRDLAYREALIDVHKLYTNKAFAGQFQRSYGPEEYKHLGDWLGRLVNSEVGDEKQSVLTAISSGTRRAMVANGVAFRISTMIKHGGSAAFKSTGYFAGGGEKYFGSRLAAMATDHNAQVVEALAKFPEIRQRARQQDRDFAQAVGSIFEPESIHGKAERFGHAGVAAMDFFTAVPTAHAAYDWAITEGIPKRLGGTGKPMSEADAIQFASKVVREAHGSTNEASQSLLINNKSEIVKALTTLHGFMNNAFGQTVDAYDKAFKANGFGKPELLARTLFAQVVPAIMAGWVTFGGPNKDESWAGWMLHHIGGEFAGMLPMVREGWSAGVEGFSSAGLPPWIRALTDTVKVVKDTVKEVHGEEVKNPIKHAGNAAGLLLPGLGQAGSTTQFLYDEITGKQHAETVGEWVRGVMSGTAKRDH